MKQSLLGRAAAIGALAVAAAGGVAPAPAVNASPTATAAPGNNQAPKTPAKSAGPAFSLSRILQALRRTGGGATNQAGGYRSRAGWTNRRYQRHALKLRNRARNRRAHRG